jgi:uncharacterized protein (DUF305 family)
MERTVIIPCGGMRYSGRMSPAVRRAAVAVATLAAVAVVGACRGSAPDDHAAPSPAGTSAVSGPARSAADVAFLQNMIKHHEQGLDLSALVGDRSTNRRLIVLMQQIAGQQGDEMGGFRAQLLQWEEPLGARAGAHIEGMVDQATVDRLKALRGADFDRLWLQSMIAHHRGAIAMAQAEIAHGQSPDVISIAKSVAAAQQDGVDRMNALLEVS